jgi:hypothetical protein
MNKINYFNFFTIQDDVTGNIREILMSREISLVTHTNISIDDMMAALHVYIHNSQATKSRSKNM